MSLVKEIEHLFYEDRRAIPKHLYIYLLKKTPNAFLVLYRKVKYLHNPAPLWENCDRVEVWEECQATKHTLVED